MTNAIIQNILTAYNFGRLQKVEKLSKGYANLNYRVQTGAAVVLCRFYKQISEEEINYEIRLLDYLKQSSFPAAYPLLRRDGEYINHSPEGCAVLFEFIDGKEPEINPETVAEIARAVAWLGTFDSIGFQKRNNINFENSEALIATFDRAPNQFPDLFADYIRLMASLHPVLKIPLPKGLVHGDIFTDNTLFEGNQLKAIIDFEFVCTDHLLFEVAMTINGFCYVENELDGDLMDVFLKNYENIRPLISLEWELLPYYIQWTALAMAAWHLENDLLHVFSEKQLARVRMFLERACSVL